MEAHGLTIDKTNRRRFVQPRIITEKLSSVYSENHCPPLPTYILFRYSGRRPGPYSAIGDQNSKTAGTEAWRYSGNTPYTRARHNPTYYDVICGLRRNPINREARGDDTR